MDQNTTVQLEGGEIGSEYDKRYESSERTERTTEEKLGLDIFHKPYSQIKSMSLWMKLHWMVAIVVNIVCVFVWRYATNDPSNSFWWWIIPMFAFAASLSLHNYIEEGRYIDGIINAAIIINVFLFTINVLTMNTEKFFFAWWVYPAIVSVMVIFPFYQFVHKSEQHATLSNAVKEASPTSPIVPYQMNWSDLVMFEYTCISLLLFLTWVNTKLGHPWFIYPILILASPIIYWRMRESEDRLWVLIIPQILIINAIVFVAWAFTSSKIPWFLPVLGVSICCVAVMWLIWRRRQKSTNDSEKQTSNSQSADPEDIVIQ